MECDTHQSHVNKAETTQVQGALNSGPRDQGLTIMDGVRSHPEEGAQHSAQWLKKPWWPANTDR
jgi:hypothetical protein